MSRFLMIVVSAAMAILSVSFACLLKWQEMSSWGWFLLAGIIFWGSALDNYNKRGIATSFDPRMNLQEDPLADGDPGVGKKCVRTRRS